MPAYEHVSNSRGLKLPQTVLHYFNSKANWDLLTAGLFWLIAAIGDVHERQALSLAGRYLKHPF